MLYLDLDNDFILPGNRSTVEKDSYGFDNVLALDQVYDTSYIVSCFNKHRSQRNRPNASAVSIKNMKYFLQGTYYII